MMKNQSCLHRIFASGFLLMASSCGMIPNQQGQVSSTAKQCPEKPNLSLEGKNVKAIVLTDQLLKENVIVKDNQAIGRTFDGKAGQKLERPKNPDVCIWVFTPENQILTGDVLPKDGKYTMQISARQGSMSFNLDLGLDVVVAASPAAASPPSSPATASIPSPEKMSEKSAEPPPRTTTQTTTYNFPMAVCGDDLPNDPNAYPLQLYPVYLPPGDANLRMARSKFCQDAISMTTGDTNMRQVQVASFTTKERAINFMNALNQLTSGATVGTPTNIPRKISQNPVESQQVVITDERVEFGLGKTDTVIQGGVSSTQQKRYLLWCSGGQSMAIQLQQQGNVRAVVLAPDGKTIGVTNQNNQQWRGRLPSSGDYTLVVFADVDSRYTIRVEVI